MINWRIFSIFVIILLAKINVLTCFAIFGDISSIAFILSDEPSMR
jgi:hypothetical protein